MGRNVLGRVVHVAKCPWDKMSLGHVVNGASCLWGKMSWGKLSMGRVVMGLVAIGHNVRDSKLLCCYYLHKKCAVHSLGGHL
jgi:hypothetical protein